MVSEVGKVASWSEEDVWNEYKPNVTEGALLWMALVVCMVEMKKK